MPSTAAPKVYVVLVNWNGWRDTLECLESLLASDYPSFEVVVCDNASQDGSADRILAWARGEQPAPESSPALAHLAPSAPKPVRMRRLDRQQAERGHATAEGDAARITVVDTGANLGFAGGCNVGARYAIARGDAAFVWFLNNDTVVVPDAMSALVRRMTRRADAGLGAARLLYFDDPTRVQSLGGVAYDWVLGRVRAIGEGSTVSAQVDVADVERRMSYVNGASMFARRDFLERVGLLDEGYFLYYEELDWAARAGGFAFAYAHDAVVYHKEGRAIGTSADPGRRSVRADYYVVRSRLRFTRRFRPWTLPTICAGILLMVVNRLRRRQWRHARAILGVLLRLGATPAGPGVP